MSQEKVDEFCKVHLLDKLLGLEDIGEPSFPVTGSVDEDIRESLGYIGMGLPTAGNIVVTPDMELLIMEPGHGGDDWAYEAILEHMSQAD